MVIVKNILAMVAGVFVGAVVNMALVMLSPVVIPPPAGVDTNDIESIKANIHLYETKHFVFPFLAHALGTLAGAFLTYTLAASRRWILALAIGAFFMVGGVMAVSMIGGPVAFAILDIAGAYLPMAALGAWLGKTVWKK